MNEPQKQLLYLERSDRQPKLFHPTQDLSPAAEAPSATMLVMEGSKHGVLASSIIDS